MSLAAIPGTSLGSSTEKATAIFAGGCFWCLQSDFDKVPGVIQTTVGYTGGEKVDPTYEEVSQGKTGHYESLQVIYDPAVISYDKLVDFFWRHVDPTDPKGQFCDVGDQYKAVIFYHDETQQKSAIESKEQLIQSGQFSNIAAEILPEKTFYPAEEYHQKYYQKNPIRYQFYRFSCGRDKKVAKVWQK